MCSVQTLWDIEREFQRPCSLEGFRVAKVCVAMTTGAQRVSFGAIVVYCERLLMASIRPQATDFLICLVLPEPHLLLGGHSTPAFPSSFFVFSFEIPIGATLWIRKLACC